MKKMEFWFKNRQFLNGQVKCDSTQQALLYADEDYPYPTPESIFFMQDSNVDMDAIGGDNFRGFLKTLNKFVRALKVNLPNGMKPIFEKARIDSNYYAKVGNERVHYYPVVIEFDDGQYLVGLARQYGEYADDPVIAKDQEIKITKWILNGKDITPVIYKTKEDIKNENISEIAKKIAILVEKNHPYFVKQFPQKQINTKEEIEAKKQELQKEIEELKKQIEELKNNLEDKNEEEEYAKIKQDIVKALKSGKTFLFQEKTSSNMRDKIAEDFEKEDSIFLGNQDDNDVSIAYGKLYGMNVYWCSGFEYDELCTTKEQVLKSVEDYYYDADPEYREKVLSELKEFLGMEDEGKEKVFNKVKSIIVESSELSDETNKKFNSFKDLQYWIVEKSAEDGILFEENPFYRKVWLKIIMSNGENDLKLSPRIDISTVNVNDFNPLEEYIVNYLEERYSNGVETSDGNVKIDLSKYEITEEEWKKMLQDFKKIVKEKSEQSESDVETRLKELLKSNDPDYINEELDKITENMSDEEIEKYEDLLNEVNDRAVELASKGV